MTTSDLADLARSASRTDSGDGGGIPLSKQAPSQDGASEYRAEIDGLRAFAVLAVLFYHADLPWVKGGFVGVDVFFVISGYLITRHIASELEQERFRLGDFYLRRIRRILPALLVMLGTVSIAAVALLLPAELINYGRSLLGAALSFSNMIFLLEGGYFRPDTELQPLLHTWSLGVEEQFYILFPLFLLLVHRIAKQWLQAVIWAAFVVSLGVSMVATITHPHWAFYFAPSRAWELLAGAILALGLVRMMPSAGYGQAMAGIALAALLASFVLVSPNRGFPGFTGLVPVLATATLIHVAPATFAGRLLSARLLVGVGLISYSLYLWHWPVLVFARYVAVEPLSPTQTLSCLAASFFLAILSWRLVERPSRDRRRLPVRPLLIATGIGTLALALAGWLLTRSSGLPERLSPEAARLAAGSQDMSRQRDSCLFRTPGTFKPLDDCLIGDKDRAPDMILWGDSHAEALRPALDVIGQRTGRAVVNGTYVSCPPLLDLTVVENGSDLGCRAWNEAMIRTVVEKDIRTVVLHARWGAYAHGEGFGTDQSKKLSLQGASSNPMQHGLTATLDRLKGRRVILVASVPEQARDVPSRTARAARFGSTRVTAVDRSVFAARQASFEQVLRPIASRYGIEVVEPAQQFCNPDCEVERQGRSLYYDSHHLSTFGARQLVPMLASAFEKSIHAGARR